MQKPIKKHQQKYAPALGGLLLILAVVGIVAVVIAGVQLTRSALDDSKDKTMLEEKILPVVMFDPVPFESPTDISPVQLLNYSLWGILSSPKATDYPVDSETQRLMIPASDMEASAYSLFGMELVLEHQSFGDTQSGRIIYEDGIYYVPTYGTLYAYTPRVETITKEGDLYYLKVGYIPPANAWVTIYTGSRTNEIAKYMIYVMRKDGSQWYLEKVAVDPNSINYVPGQLIDSSSASQTTPPASSLPASSSAVSGEESTSESTPSTSGTDASATNPLPEESSTTSSEEVTS